MGLCDVVSSYVHNVGLIDYMMKSCLTYMKISILVLLMYGMNDMIIVSL